MSPQGKERPSAVFPAHRLHCSLLYCMQCTSSNYLPALQVTCFDVGVAKRMLLEMYVLKAFENRLTKSVPQSDRLADRRDGVQFLL